DKELSRLRYQLSCRTSGTPTNSRPPSAGSHPSPYFPTPSSQGSPIMGPPNRPTPGRSSHNFNEKILVRDQMVSTCSSVALTLVCCHPEMSGNIVFLDVKLEPKLNIKEMFQSH
ncbi:unnamed protein product, partial [Timema podura]|nr:unnamed protein product [Timema podura]